MPKVNPAILRWARESAGLSVEEAVAKLRLRDARGVAAIDRLQAVEDGDAIPTRPMLVKMTKHYRQPLVAFYLSKPPQRGSRGQDFRTLPEDRSRADEPLLDTLIRDVQARQSLVRAALVDEGDVRPLAFVGSVSTRDGNARVLEAIRTTLDLPLDEYRRARGIDEAFQLLRSHVEEAGVFVLLLGNLGSHHTNIDVETFRGFALSDHVAPFIVINDQDHHGAWSFTLLHELTHLFLGQTGISGGAPERGIERFCNDVASEFLLPAAEIDQLRDVASSDLERTAAMLSAFATERNVSRSMVAYKLYRLAIITHATWRGLSQHFRDRWLEDREDRKARFRTREGGPDYYVVRRHRLGPALVGTTARLMAAGALTTTKAGTVLGVKPKNVQHLINEYSARAS